MRGRGTQRVVTWACDTCGNNNIEIVRAVHNRFFRCQCGDYIYKNTDFIINGELAESEKTVERIALGWG